MTPMLLNLILCSAVFVVVVAPLVWAILAAHRDEPSATASAARRLPSAQPRPHPGHRRDHSRMGQPARPHGSKLSS